MFTLLMLAALCAARAIPNNNQTSSSTATSKIRGRLMERLRMSPLVPRDGKRPDGVKVDWAKSYGKGETFGIRIQMDRQTAEATGKGISLSRSPLRTVKSTL